MSILGKVFTAARLLGRGDLPMIRRQWSHHTAQRRLRRYGGRPFVHRDPGFPFVCHPDWPDSVDQFCGNAGDHWEFQLLQHWLRPRDAALDIGASLGLYTFAFAHAVGPGGRVVSVEASPFVHGKLRESVTLLQTPQVVPLHAAVTGASGTVTFFVRRDNNVTTEQSLVPTPEQRAWTHPVEVPAVTLAQIATQYIAGSTPALLKIDIEGAEAAALSATPPPWLTAEGPFWILEINPSALARFGGSAGEVIDRFPSDHFERWLLAKHPVSSAATIDLYPLPDTRALNAVDLSRSLYYNFFALPRGTKWAGRAAGLRAFFGGSHA